MSEQAMTLETRPLRVAIVVLNWNGWRDTLRCLESLARLEYPCFEALVVDNGSTDGSAQRDELGHPPRA